MNIITIIGILFITLGTFLTYYGTHLSSRQDKKEMENAFAEKFSELRNQATTNTDRRKVDDAENEFQSWANNFRKNIDSLKLQLEKTDLSIKQTINNANQQYIYLYEYFFNCLKNAIIAYNTNNPNKLSFDIPDFPNSIFGKEATNYIAKIQFNIGIVWYFSLVITQPLTELELPLIIISKKEDYNLNDPYGNSISIRFYPKESKFLSDKITIHVNDQKIPITTLTDHYDLNTDSIKSIIRALIEFQLLRN